jgi:hypothetical protein
VKFHIQDFSKSIEKTEISLKMGETFRGVSMKTSQQDTLVLASGDGCIMVGGRDLERPAPHSKVNLGYWGREVQKNGLNKPFC